MNVNFSLSGSMEIPASLLSLIEGSGQSVEDYISGLIESARDNFPEFLAEAELSIETEDDSEPSAPVSRPVRQSTAKTAVPVAHKPTTARPAATQDTDGMAPARSGRPPLKKEADGTRWEASDGGTVTEFGNRSVQELKTQGIAARKVGATAWPRWYENAIQQDENESEDADSWTPAPRKSLPSPKSERTAVRQSASAPVMKRRVRS